jgi:hypothetical protein
MAASTNAVSLQNRIPRGPQHKVVEWTAEQIADYEKRVEAELAGIGENRAYFSKLRQAARQSGFNGDLLRAIAASRKAPPDLARVVGIDEERLDQFCTGEGTLTSDDAAKLVDFLGLKLVRVLS